MNNPYNRACDAAGHIHKIGDVHCGIYILVDEVIDNGVEQITTKAKESDVIAYEEMIARWERLSQREKEQYDILRALERA